MTDRKIEFIGEEKTPYQVNITDDLGYAKENYYFKFTKEELNIIQWFLTETGTMHNFELIRIEKDIFSERKTD